MKISVIIPVYNVREYLDKCMYSILHQTFNDYEIILIDDGSNDGSQNLCDEYANDYQIVRTVHKKNGGLSDARNSGIRVSQAEYITFIDSDDYVENDYLEYLYKLICKSMSDISVAGTFVVDKDGNILREFDKYTSKVMSPKDALNSALYQDAFDISAWGKLYHKNLFNKRVFKKNILFEDLDLIPYLILDSTSIAYGNESKYYYLQRENSIVSSQFNNKKLELVAISQRLLENINDDSMRPAVVRRYVYSNIYLLNQIIRENGSDKNAATCRVLKKNISRYSRELLKNNHVSIRDKIAVVLIKYFGLSVYSYIRKFQV